MNKITRQDVEGMFKRLCRNMNKKIAESYNDVGAWNLEYIACYGGFKVEEIACKSGSICHPLSDRRLTTREMYEALYMTNCAIENFKRES